MYDAGDFMILLPMLAIGLVLSGPIALVVAIIALKRTRKILEQLQPQGGRVRSSLEGQPKDVEPARPTPVPGKTAPTPMPAWTQPALAEAKRTSPSPPKTGTLEQRIGTWWVLIAGVITVIVGVGFFLKYAYDNALIGPMGRVAIAAFWGLAALCVGEITRRKGYGIVARAVTSLGFAILYTAVFSAYRFYGLIDPATSFGLAILVTLAAMAYAVSLDEITVAVLSLAGGFMTPVIVTTGENLPVPLFCYILILGTGAVFCAYFKKWRAVNILAFAGTFALYAAWFERFFRPAMKAAREMHPDQMAIALGWLGVFFAVYLVLPLFNELVRKARAQKEDVLLVLANASVTFYYLWAVLFANYRMELAFCAIALCAAHLAVLSAVVRRCRQDVDLRLALLWLGLFFLTIAIPLYLKMYAVAMAWAIEAVVLAAIGLRYRSIWTQICAVVALLLSIGQLINHLPIHTAAFRPAINPAFGSWLFVSACMAVCHVLYRVSRQMKPDYRDAASQAMYCGATLVLSAAALMEWFWHCRYNIQITQPGRDCHIIGTIVIFIVIMMLPLIRPLCPAGPICRILGFILGIAGSLFMMIRFPGVYRETFVIFLNSQFAVAMLFTAGLFVAAFLLRAACDDDCSRMFFAKAFALAGVFVLWMMLNEQIYLYWYWKNEALREIANWRFLSNMYISVMWAVYGAALMTVGFWRRIPALRYVSLALFCLLLVKVFILDMSTVKSVYRITAFLATGVTLVGVSYLYQFVKNKGFFEALLTEKKLGA